MVDGYGDGKGVEAVEIGLRFTAKVNCIIITVRWAIYAVHIILVFGKNDHFCLFVSSAT